MTKKRTVQKVIIEGVMQNYANSPSCFVLKNGDFITLVSLPDKCVPSGTHLKIVALVDAPEPERLEGAEWLVDPFNPGVSLLLSNKKFLARADVVGNYWLRDGKGVIAASGMLSIRHNAQQAAEEALADAGLYEFGREEVEPIYNRYEVSSLTFDKYYDYEDHFEKEKALEIYHNWKSRKCTKIAVLWAQDINLNWHELDRYESVDDK